MATIDESIGHSIETEIESKEDEISKQGGLNISLEDFTASGVRAPIERENQEARGDGRPEFQMRVVNNDITETTITTATAQGLGQFISDKALSDNDGNLLGSQDTNAAIEQNEELGNTERNFRNTEENEEKLLT